jgi:hypothetical protein
VVVRLPMQPDEVAPGQRQHRATMVLAKAST